MTQNIKNILKRGTKDLRKQFEEIQLIANTSVTYYNGSLWETNNYGICRIVGMIEKRRNYHTFLVEFDDGTQLSARHHNIKNGTLKNPYYYGAVCGVGCLGNMSSRHKLYPHWKQMLERCYNPSTKSYIDYGGRGIFVSENWLCFEYFIDYLQNVDKYEDLLQNHKIYEVDRIDNNGNYEEENIRIVTRSENSRNKRSNRYIKINLPSGESDIGLITDIVKNMI